jgi:hypothetical protein
MGQGLSSAEIAASQQLHGTLTVSPYETEYEKEHREIGDVITGAVGSSVQVAGPGQVGRPVGSQGAGDLTQARQMLAQAMQVHEESMRGEQAPEHEQLLQEALQEHERAMARGPRAEHQELLEAALAEQREAMSGEAGAGPRTLKQAFPVFSLERIKARIVEERRLGPPEARFAKAKERIAKEAAERLPMPSREQVEAFKRQTAQERGMRAYLEGMGLRPGTPAYETRKRQTRETMAYFQEQHKQRHQLHRSVAGYGLIPSSAMGGAQGMRAYLEGLGLRPGTDAYKEKARQTQETMEWFQEAFERFWHATGGPSGALRLGRAFVKGEVQNIVKKRIEEANDRLQEAYREIVSKYEEITRMAQLEHEQAEKDFASGYITQEELMEQTDQILEFAKRKHKEAAEQIEDLKKEQRREQRDLDAFLTRTGLKEEESPWDWPTWGGATFTQDYGGMPQWGGAPFLMDYDWPVWADAPARPAEQEEDQAELGTIPGIPRVPQEQPQLSPVKPGAGALVSDELTGGTETLSPAASGLEETWLSSYGVTLPRESRGSTEIEALQLPELELPEVPKVTVDESDLRIPGQETVGALQLPPTPELELTRALFQYGLPLPRGPVLPAPPPPPPRPSVAPLRLQPPLVVPPGPVTVGVMRLPPIQAQAPRIESCEARLAERLRYRARLESRIDDLTEQMLDNRRRRLWNEARRKSELRDSELAKLQRLNEEIGKLQLECGHPIEETKEPCGPDVTGWFISDLQAQLNYLMNTLGDIERNERGPSREIEQSKAFVNQVKYLLGYKWMDFPPASCGTGRCANTVRLANVCLYKNQLGNIAFGFLCSQFLGRSAVLGAYLGDVGRFKTTDEHPFARNWDPVQGEFRTDNLAAFGVGMSFGSRSGFRFRKNRAHSRHTRSVLISQLAGLLKSRGALGSFSIYNLPRYPNPRVLTSTPLYGGFNTASCKPCTSLRPETVFRGPPYSGKQAFLDYILPAFLQNPDAPPPRTWRESGVNLRKYGADSVNDLLNAVGGDDLDRWLEKREDYTMDLSGNRHYRGKK